ncbi:MAG: hypothetical protein BWZ00_00933 [Bacteroidetes bacterium ADurb.BinA174]|nr:MAG: hypothetical protein BWZ00_00933 [Bacteroidetes bacterium ADurb.BinA174]
MKKHLFYFTLLFSLALASCENDPIAETVTLSLENKLTAANTEWTGDKSGTEIKGEYGSTWKNQFSGSDNFFVFDNYFGDYSWGGFMYTNKTDITTTGATNNSAITGSGKNGKVYLTVNTSSYTPAVISFKDGQAHKFTGMFVTNATYAYLSMKNGDGFAKKFASGDWFKLEIFGKTAQGTDTPSVEVYLADFRNGKTEILSTWKWVSLETLGNVKSLHFKLSSTDNGEWGMNTPSYFCMDGVTAIK